MKEFEGKKLLVLGGIKLACDIVQRAQRLGAYVIVADYNVDSPAKQIADEGILIDATNVGELVSYCRKSHIDGVTTGFVDILMPVCYEVCKQLGLPYYATPKMLSMATNKDVFKKTCSDYGIPVPKTYYIGSSLPDNIISKVKYPVFVKPMDASGSRGAGVCYNNDDLIVRFNEAVGFSKTKNAIIEDYITGREFLLDYIAVDGEFRLLSMFDRYMCEDRGSAINYSNISIAPAKKIENYLDTMNDKVIAMFKDLGFKDGLLFMQGHTDGKKTTYYEMGCRLGGSFYNLEKACIGYDPAEMVVRYALTGKMVNDISSINTRIAKFDKYAVVCNYLLDLSSGEETIANITGLNEIESMNSCVAISQHRHIGQTFKQDTIVDKPVITAFLVEDNLDDVKRDINYINNIFDVRNTKGNSILMKKYNPELLYQ